MTRCCQIYVLSDSICEIESLRFSIAVIPETRIGYDEYAEARR